MSALPTMGGAKDSGTVTSNSLGNTLNGAQSTGYMRVLPNSNVGASCPHCGYCPHCGRSSHQPYYPWFTQPYCPTITYTANTCGV